MIIDELYDLRLKLEKVFTSDTAAVGSNLGIPSAGHCAAVAVLVNTLYGGEFVSTKINGISHWFNRLDSLDVDLTGDQFGFPPVQITPSGNLYLETRTREVSELNQETLSRAQTLASRVGIELSSIFDVSNV